MTSLNNSTGVSLALATGLLALSSVLMAQSDKHLSHAEALSAAISKPQPEYPAMAKQLKVEGTVEMTAFVNEDGIVEKADIVSGNPILARAAQDTLKRWKFSKMVTDGKPCKFAASVSFSFKL